MFHISNKNQIQSLSPIAAESTAMFQSLVFSVRESVNRKYNTDKIVFRKIFIMKYTFSGLISLKNEHDSHEYAN